MGAQQGEDLVPASASTRPAAVPPPGGSSPTLAPGMLQLQASWEPFLRDGTPSLICSPSLGFGGVGKLQVTGLRRDRDRARGIVRQRLRAQATLTPGAYPHQGHWGVGKGLLPLHGGF